MVDISIDPSCKISNITPTILEDIKKSITVILSDFDHNESYCSITICNDAFIHKMNKHYRNKNQPTDVLAFAFDDHTHKIAHPIRYLGEIIISAETAWTQALELDILYQEELLRLCIHGTLHLLGFDHEKGPHAHKIMSELQDKYMDRFITEIRKNSDS